MDFFLTKMPNIPNLWRQWPNFYVGSSIFFKDHKLSICPNNVTNRIKKDDFKKCHFSPFGPKYQSFVDIQKNLFEFFEGFLEKLVFFNEKHIFCMFFLAFFFGFF